MGFQTLSARTMPVIRQGQQKGGLGPFAQQLAMFSLAPIATDMASNMLNSVLPGLMGQTGGKFSLTGDLQMISLPNHLSPSAYLLFPHSGQKGRGTRKRWKHC